MIKKFIKNTTRFAAKQLVKAIVEGQLRQNLYNQRFYQPYVSPFDVSGQKQELDNSFEITWSPNATHTVCGNTAAN